MVTWLVIVLGLAAILVLGGAAQLALYLRQPPGRQDDEPTSPWREPSTCPHEWKYRERLGDPAAGRNWPAVWQASYRCRACGRSWSRTEGL